MKMFTSAEIMTKTQEYLKYQIQEKQRQLLLIQGQIEAWEAILAIINQWDKAEKN